MKLTILASGSKGNLSVIEAGKAKLLVDVGLSLKATICALSSIGISPLEIDGILLTHEHADHAKGAKAFIERYKPVVVCTDGTAHKVGIRDNQFTACIRDCCKIDSFPVPHDAIDPVGFTVDDYVDRFGIATDLGYVARNVVDHLSLCDLVYLEASYDENLILNSQRHPSLIKRITSSHGHLSNDRAGQGIADILSHNLTTRFVIGHLSRECNTPELALATIQQHAPGADVVCHHDKPLRLITP